jgi:hypothetical protein
VGFYESIATDPQALLRDVFAFLGVTPDVSWGRFRAAERILPGPAGELTPALEGCLRRLLRGRTRELASFLREGLGLTVPPEWETTLGPREAAGGATDPSPAFAGEFDDRYLGRVLEQEETFPAAPRLVHEDYRGYSLVFYRRRLYALARHLGRVCLDEVGEADLRAHWERGDCLIAPSETELKERVDRQVFDRMGEQLRAAEGLWAELREARASAARLEGTLGRVQQDLQRAEGALRAAEADLARLPPGYLAAARWLGKVGRRLRSYLGPCGSA